MPRGAGQQGGMETRPARLQGFYEKECDPMQVRTAYRCRAYPDAEQQAVLNRTFGSVRVAWNRTLAERQARWRRERQGTSYAETDRALTAMKKDPGLAFLNEVSCVPLQQALRHQHKAFSAFFAGRARSPGSSPGPGVSPRTTPGRRSPCAPACCSWRRRPRRCGSSGPGPTST